MHQQSFLYAMNRSSKTKNRKLDLFTNSKFINGDLHFATNNFKFRDNDFQLLRSRFPYKTIPYKDIQSIEIVRGIRTKRPILLSLYAILFLILVPYFFPIIKHMNVELAHADEEFAYTDFMELYYYIILTGGFFLSVGIISLWQAIIPTWILRVYLKDNTKEVFSLLNLKRKKNLNVLLHFLMLKFKPDKLRIATELKQKFLQ